MATKFTKPSHMTASEEKRWEALVAKALETEKAYDTICREDSRMMDRHDEEQEALLKKQEVEQIALAKKYDKADHKMAKAFEAVDDLEDKILDRKDLVIASQKKKIEEN